MIAVSVFVNGQPLQEVAFEAVPRVGELIATQGSHFVVNAVRHAVTGNNTVQVQINMVNANQAQIF